MRTTSLLPLTLALAGVHAFSIIAPRASQVQGFDISNWQPTFDFDAAYQSGARFCMIKATEGDDYINKYFSSHYTGATKAGIIRGGYHFAWPISSASEQADFFLAHGGGWTSDGRTLPGMLDLESTSGKPKCWGLTTNQMVAWIMEFSDRYHSKTKRYLMLYFNPSWWKECTGDSTAFKDTNPLVLARWASSVGSIPGGWKTHTI
ncbi:glycoside hydrolase family 25 protein [Lasiosphaeris hirsuta]|uniref:Lysozyme n=1 Tax=Lasiosphaeris hirsuta TaxID=260670 RepID=A0AA39ZSE9_9PEZI|nr:glycoside hydrolase family 25 protein [Lasiosphaeris hirsuta]